MGLALCFSTRATLAYRRGLLDKARQLFLAIGNEGWAVVPTHLDFNWRLEAAEVCLRSKRFEEAEHFLSSLAQAPIVKDHPGVKASFRRTHGLLLEGKGSIAASEEVYLQSLNLGREAGEALELGRTLLTYGSFLRRQGRKNEARGLLDEAVLVFHGCGSSLWAGWAEDERKMAGGRRRVSNPAMGHLESLTAQEYRIAELLAQGRSNREVAYTLFISPNTLQSHLRHIYRKLRVSSRQDLKAYFHGEKSGAGVRL
jgi:DNA-binding CsgD family transcriptional regulator